MVQINPLREWFKIIMVISQREHLKMSPTPKPSFWGSNAAQSSFPFWLGSPANINNDCFINRFQRLGCIEEFLLCNILWPARKVFTHPRPNFQKTTVPQTSTTKCPRMLAKIFLHTIVQTRSLQSKSWRQLTSWWRSVPPIHQAFCLSPPIAEEYVLFASKIFRPNFWSATICHSQMVRYWAIWSCSSWLIGSAT